MDTNPERTRMLAQVRSAAYARLIGEQKPNPAYTAFGNRHGGYAVLTVASLINGALAGFVMITILVTMQGSTGDTKSDIIFPIWGVQVLAFLVMLFAYVRWLYAVGTLITLGLLAFALHMAPF